MFSLTIDWAVNQLIVIVKLYACLNSLFINRFWIYWLIDRKIDCRALNPYVYWYPVGQAKSSITSLFWRQHSSVLFYSAVQNQNIQVQRKQTQYTRGIYLLKNHPPRPLLTDRLSEFLFLNCENIFENKYHYQVIKRWYKFHYFGFPYLQKSPPPPRGGKIFLCRQAQMILYHKLEWVKVYFAIVKLILP